MRRFAVQLARARARDRWIVAKRCVLRSTSGKLLRLLFFSPLSRVFRLSFSRRFRRAGSFRLLWPIVQKTDRGSAVSFSHLVAFISRCDPLHNVHLCRPAKRCRAPKQRQSTPTPKCSSFLFISIVSLLFRTHPLAMSLRLFIFIYLFIF